MVILFNNRPTLANLKLDIWKTVIVGKLTKFNKILLELLNLPAILRIFLFLIFNCMSFNCCQPCNLRVN